MNLKNVLVILVSLNLTFCKTPTKRAAPKRAPGKETIPVGIGETRDPVDPHKLPAPTFKLETMTLCASDKAPLVLLAEPTAGDLRDFSQYQVCSDRDSKTCSTGSMLVQSPVLPTTEAGSYKIRVRSCVEDKHRAGSDSCGNWSDEKTYSSAGLNPTTTRLINKQLDLRDAMTKVCEDIQSSMTLYLQQETNTSEPLRNEVKKHLDLVGKNNCLDFLLSQDLRLLDALSQLIDAGKEPTQTGTVVTNNTYTQRSHSLVEGGLFLGLGGAGLLLSLPKTYLAIRDTLGKKSAEIAKLIINLEKKKNAAEIAYLDVQVKAVTDLKFYMEQKPITDPDAAVKQIATDITAKQQEIENTLARLKELWNTNPVPESDRADWQKKIISSVEVHVKSGNSDLVWEAFRTLEAEYSAKYRVEGWFVKQPALPGGDGGKFHGSDRGSPETIYEDLFNHMKKKAELERLSEAKAVYDKWLVENPVHTFPAGTARDLSFIIGHLQKQKDILDISFGWRVWAATKAINRAAAAGALQGAVVGGVGGGLLGEVFGSFGAGPGRFAGAGAGAGIGAAAKGLWDGTKEGWRRFLDELPLDWTSEEKAKLDSDSLQDREALKKEIETKISEREGEKMKDSLLSADSLKAKAAAALPWFGVMLASSAMTALGARDTLTLVDANPKANFLKKYQELYLRGEDIQEQYAQTWSALTSPSCKGPEF